MILQNPIHACQHLSAIHLSALFRLLGFSIFLILSRVICRNFPPIEFPLYSKTYTLSTDLGLEIRRHKA
ncbi:hypothetical protein D1BOALGB6SA_2656 [Olavius sp. associated proteobacterium Delta 1]|nr:hypothetical protein D1BOALGB6SA_2656 [Olavius sp. associated proteobacterium Delta 1]